MDIREISEKSPLNVASRVSYRDGMMENVTLMNGD